MTRGGEAGGLATALRADLELARAHWVLKSYTRPSEASGPPKAVGEELEPPAESRDNPTDVGRVTRRSTNTVRQVLLPQRGDEQA